MTLHETLPQRRYVPSLVEIVLVFLDFYVVSVIPYCWGEGCGLHLSSLESHKPNNILLI